MDYNHLQITTLNSMKKNKTPNQFSHLRSAQGLTFPKTEVIR